MKIVVFGAESTGKTTLAKALAEKLHAYYVPEFARDYLEDLGSPQLTDEHMYDIWHGQWVSQTTLVHFLHNRPIIFDTDLLSTVGYWDMWKPGHTPVPLVMDAEALKADLYLICLSNIPFTPDPLRYGVDKRETEDQYWVDIAEAYDLNYRLIQSSNLEDRIAEAESIIFERVDRAED